MLEVGAPVVPLALLPRAGGGGQHLGWAYGLIEALFTCAQTVIILLIGALRSVAKGEAAAGGESHLAKTARDFAGPSLLLKVCFCGAALIGLLQNRRNAAGADPRARRRLVVDSMVDEAFPRAVTPQADSPAAYRPPQAA